MDMQINDEFHGNYYNVVENVSLFELE